MIEKQMINRNRHEMKENTGDVSGNNVHEQKRGDVSGPVRQDNGTNLAGTDQATQKHINRNSDRLTNEKVSFEDIFKQNERRIHYHIHKLHIQDPHNEFYVEGLFAMWNAYKKYRPDQGTMSTYFNYMIRNRLIDMLRKKTRETNNKELYIQRQKPNLDNGNRDCRNNISIPAMNDLEVNDDTFWENVRALLTANQWKWVRYYIIEEMSLKEIAKQEGVTVEAVKSWRKTAKKRLKNAGIQKWLDGSE